MKIIFIICALILIFIVIYRNSSGKGFYKLLGQSIEPIYDKIAPYSFRQIRKKIKEMGQEYTPQQYLGQIVLFAGVAAILTFLYFYSIIIMIDIEFYYMLIIVLVLKVQLAYGKVHIII